MVKKKFRWQTVLAGAGLFLIFYAAGVFFFQKRITGLSSALFLLVSCAYIVLAYPSLVVIKKTNLKLLYFQNIRKITLVFAAYIGLLVAIVRLFSRYIDFDCPFAWPVSVFELSPLGADALLYVFVALLLFYCMLRYGSKRKPSLIVLIVLGTALISCTNFFHGWRNGLIMPIAGVSTFYEQYFHEVAHIKNVLGFLRHFNFLQADLALHARTHPPGAVLLMYWLFNMFKSVSVISIAIVISSVSVSVAFFYKILRKEFNDELSRYACFLFLLIPAIQIYYLATVDALIAALLLGALYCFMQQKMPVNIIGTVVFSFCASFLTFGFVFILPVMIIFEAMKRKSIVNSMITIFCIVSLYEMVRMFFGFDYFRSFLMASLLENPQGFLLFSDPTSYIFTRIENVVEIILFFGPFLTLIAFKGVASLRRCTRTLFVPFVAAIVTLFVMFLTGAFRSGETARICLFLYPYLLFPVIAWLHEENISLKEKNRLLCLVFGQAVLMQLAGSYFW